MHITFHPVSQGLLESLGSLGFPLGMCAGFQPSRDVRTYLWPWWLSHFQILLGEFLTSLTVLCSPHWDCNLGSDRKKGFCLLFPTEFAAFTNNTSEHRCFCCLPKSMQLLLGKVSAFPGQLLLVGPFHWLIWGGHSGTDGGWGSLGRNAPSFSS